MITLPTQPELLAHQIVWYTQRLKEEKNFEARIFLRKTLYHLKLTLK